jgi:hypothetical protein
MLTDLNHTIDYWINELEQYSFTQLCIQPSPGNWSLGQMYRHLIDDTRFYIEQIKTCISANDNAMEQASPTARAMFADNSFPDQLIEGAPGNNSIPQPASKEELRSCLLNIKDEINRLSILVSESLFKGKTKHPGFNYFSAEEWLQFAEMHFRHHLRQKKRIDMACKTAT